MTATERKLEGWVEEVDSGKQSIFLSDDQLIAFLRDCFNQTHQKYRKDGTNEPNGDGP